jgi:hypothetical protein
LALLAYVRPLIPPGISVLRLGDSEFGAVEVIQELEAWGWPYVLRQKASRLIRLPSGDWQRFGVVIWEPGQSRWLGQGQLTREHGHPTNLLAHWEKGENEPWLLATHLSSRRETLKAYRRRMWVVVLLYVWLVAEGSWVIKNSQRHQVDQADRRDLS